MKYPNDIASCHKLLEEQSKLISRLIIEVQELKSRLNQNSSNSSKPPSSDIHKPKRKPALEKKPKKRGG